MKRRTLIAGTAGSIGGAITLTGSSAFSFARAERDLKVAVEGDNVAYLGLRQLGSGERSSEDGTPEQVYLSFPGLREAEYNPNDPNGLGTDSVYEFTSEASGDTKGLIEITNQGTNDVVVKDDQPETDGPRLELFDLEDSNRAALREDPRSLEVGNSFRVGVRIDTHDVKIGDGDGPNGEYEETIELIAKEQP